MASTHPNDPILPTRLQAPEHGVNLATLEVIDGDHVDGSQPFQYAMAAAQAMRTDPSDIAQACMQADWLKWDQSIHHEVEKQLEQMETWDLVNLPKGANIVRSHLVFHYKLNTAGNVASHKFRLITQGFSQQGVDYNKTFPLMVLCPITLTNNF